MYHDTCLCKIVTTKHNENLWFIFNFHIHVEFFKHFIVDKNMFVFVQQNPFEIRYVSHTMNTITNKQNYDNIISRK